MCTLFTTAIPIHLFDFYEIFFITVIYLTLKYVVLLQLHTNFTFSKTELSVLSGISKAVILMTIRTQPKNIVRGTNKFEHAPLSHKHHLHSIYK